VAGKVANPPEAVVGSTPAQATLKSAGKAGDEDGARDGNPAAHDPFERIPALAHIRARSPGGGQPQDKLTHAGQDVHMLMPIDEIGGRAPCLLKGVELMLELGVNLLQVELAEKRLAHQLTKSGQTASGRQTAQARERAQRGQGDVQTHIRLAGEWR
jgi:hypothetical protein